MVAQNIDVDDRDNTSWYLHMAGRYPRLTHEQEIALAQRIEAHDTAALHALVEHNLLLVVANAKYYATDEYPLLDLLQEGNVGLMHAAQKYDWRKGWRFSTYATWWIRQYIQRYVAQNRRHMTLPVHAGGRIARAWAIARNASGENGVTEIGVEAVARQMHISEVEALDLLESDVSVLSLDVPLSNGHDAYYSLEEILPDPLAQDHEAVSELRHDINITLADLPERERTVIAYRYGLVDGQEHTLCETGNQFHPTLSRERVRQIEQDALRMLRSVRSSQLLRDYM